MARQDPNPPPWDDSMSDGCSGVLDWLPFVGSLVKCCRRHDRAFHYGGTEADFQRANEEFKKCIQRRGRERCRVCYWIALAVARWRKWGVDRFGRASFNWLGPGEPG